MVIRIRRCLRGEKEALVKTKEEQGKGILN